MKTPTTSPAREAPETPAENRIIRRFGGRHLIFRTRVGGWQLVPHPYLLISNFRGPVWVFYGIGQIWLTHRKVRLIGSWIVRAPRLASARLLALVDRLQAPLEAFVRYCEEHGIEGTLVLEQKTIEFHWTFGQELAREKQKPDHSSDLETQFGILVAAYRAVTETA